VETSTLGLLRPTEDYSYEGLVFRELAQPYLPVINMPAYPFYCRLFHWKQHHVAWKTGLPGLFSVPP
jgi:hypothetical protein